MTEQQYVTGCLIREEGAYAVTFFRNEDGMYENDSDLAMRNGDFMEIGPLLMVYENGELRTQRLD